MNVFNNQPVGTLSVLWLLHFSSHLTVARSPARNSQPG
jgi:hypothetical protein